MSGDDLIATGSGVVKYLLMIEGWPHLFATDDSITAADWLDGRAVIPGLAYGGEIADSIQPSAGRVEADGITFRIVPPYGTLNATSMQDPVTASLAYYPEPYGSLSKDEADTLEDDTATIVLEGGVLLATNGIYHLGTEAVRCTNGTTGAVTRAIWDTLPQSHHTSRIDASRSVYVYERPPTMQGRHAYLYRFDAADDHTGGNNEALDSQPNPIWRGIVSRPPRSSKDSGDAVSWLIECLPITHVLRQQLAGGVGTVKPVGIYHHNKAGFAFQLQFNGTLGDVYQYFGFDGDEQGVMDGVNALLATALTAIGADAYVENLLLQYNKVDWQINFHRNSTVGLDSFGIRGGSFICGFTDTLMRQGFFFPVQSGSSWSPPLAGDDPIATNSSYTVHLTWDKQYMQRWWTGNEYAYNGVPACPLGYASHVVDPTQRNSFDPSFFETTGATWPVWRVYVDQEIEASINHVTIDGTLGFGNLWQINIRGTHSVTLGGVTQLVPYLDLKPRFQAPPPGGSGITGGGTTKLFWQEEAPIVGFWGVLGADNKIASTRAPAEGSVATFVARLIENAVDANDGDAPWITSADFATWEMGDTAFEHDVLLRIYQFVRPIAIEDVLAPEIMFAAHIMRIGLTGLLELTPMFLPTDGATVDEDHTLDESSIITPADDYGAWITAEPQADGVVATLLVQQKYDAVGDTWLDDPKIIQNPDAIATHKNRGTQKVEIKLYSAPLAGGADDVAVLSTAADHTGETFLRFASQDYTQLTVKVPFTKFAILCGDKVKITHRSIPDGLGGRGVTNRVCMCVGRRWPLDPKEGAYGELTLWMFARPSYGYAPTARLSGWTNTSGNIWEISIDSAEGFNVNVSTNGDGKVWEHFEVGDLIRIVQWDSRTPTIVVGTVTIAPTVLLGIGTLTVSLTGAWVPGDAEVNTWLLEFKDAPASSTAHMKQFAYVAESNRRLPYATTTFARRLT
jgi:hypothetical protein